MKYLFLFTLASFFSFASFAQTKEQKAVGAVVEKLRKAMVDADKPALESIAADSLSYGHSGGKVENKTEFVENIVSGKSDFVSIDLSEQIITVAGNNAIVRHVLNAATNDAGKPGTVKLRVLLVWVKEKGQWKLLARQAVKVV